MLLHALNAISGAEFGKYITTLIKLSLVPFFSSQLYRWRPVASGCLLVKKVQNRNNCKRCLSKFTNIKLKAFLTFLNSVLKNGP